MQYTEMLEEELENGFFEATLVYTPDKQYWIRTGAFEYEDGFLPLEIKFKPNGDRLEVWSGAEYKLFSLTVEDIQEELAWAYTQEEWGRSYE
jgi:hypothetical protein